METQRITDKFANGSTISRFARIMHVTIREMHFPIFFLLVFPLSIGLLLSIIGPFGTFVDLDFGRRLVYWVSIAWINWLQLGIFWILFKELKPGIGFGQLLAISLVLSAIPASFEVIGLEAWMRPDIEPKPWIQMYAYVLILSVCVYTPVVWASPKLFDRYQKRRNGHQIDPSLEDRPISDEKSTAETKSSASESCVVNLLTEQLPANLQGEIYCLKSEDHYLRVYTEKGECLILYRMKDAVEQMKHCPGARAHRSYWVNLNAVTRRNKSQGKQFLVLKNGLTVPVSRSYVDELNALFDESEGR